MKYEVRLICRKDCQPRYRHLSSASAYQQTDCLQPSASCHRRHRFGFFHQKIDQLLFGDLPRGKTLWWCVFIFFQKLCAHSVRNKLPGTRSASPCPPPPEISTNEAVREANNPLLRSSVCRQQHDDPQQAQREQWHALLTWRCNR